MSTLLESKFVGTLLGGAIGDALGKDVEDLTEEEVRDLYGGRIENYVGPNPGETSDETTISLLLLESILSRKRIDPYDFFQRLYSWRLQEEKHRYPDPALLTAIDLLSAGVSLTEAGFYSCSVEGILRCTVVGLYHFNSPYVAAEGGRLVSLITHRSKEIYDTSAMLSAFVSYLVSQDSCSLSWEEAISLLHEIKGFARYPQHAKVIDRVVDLLSEGADLEDAIKTLGNSTHVLEAFPLSLFIFVRRIGEPLEALYDAVNCYGPFGGDTDAVGYLVGSYLGALHGDEIFPRHLVENLKDLSYYINSARALYQLTLNQLNI